MNFKLSNLIWFLKILIQFNGFISEANEGPQGKYSPLATKMDMVAAKIEVTTLILQCVHYIFWIKFLKNHFYQKLSYLIMYDKKYLQGGPYLLARYKQSNSWHCVPPRKNIFGVKYSNDSTLLWHITIFQQNLPHSIEYSKISSTEISFGTHLHYFE